VFKVLTALLLITLLGCRSGDADLQRYRVIRASEAAYGLKLTVTYQYDEQGRLTTIVDYPDTSATGPTSAQTTVYYNPVQSSYIDHVDRRLTQPAIDADGVVTGTRRSYAYNDKGQLTTVNEFKAQADFDKLKLVQTYQYVYDTNGLPATLTITGPGPRYARDMYSFALTDGNAMLIGMTSTTAYTTVPRISQATVRFDEAPNIYNGFFALYPGITSFNRNNVITENTTHYHDSRGLLIRRVKMGAYIDDVTTYQYEAY
jgi:hypothetical protein